jgi:hypothetical protein
MFHDQFIHSVKHVSLLYSIRKIVVHTTIFHISYATILFHHTLLFVVSLAKVRCSPSARIDPGEAVGTFPQVVQAGGSAPVLSIATPVPEEASVAISPHSSYIAGVIVGVPVVEFEVIEETVSFPATIGVTVHVIEFVVLLEVLLGGAAGSPIVMRIRMRGKVGTHLQSAASPWGGGYRLSMTTQRSSFEGLLRSVP